MPRIFAFVFSIFIAITFTTVTEAQWKQSAHKFDEGVVTLTVNSGILYASTAMDGIYDFNIFTSADGGITWKPLSPKMPNSYAKKLFISTAKDGSKYLFACTEFNVYRLKLGSPSATWSENHDIIGQVTSMAQIKKYGQSIYASVGDLGLYRSDDNGEHWIQQNFISIDNYNAVKFLPIVATDSNYYVGTTKGLFISSGATSGALTQSPNFAITRLVSSGKNLFAFNEFAGGMLLSSDNGKSWAQVNAGLENCKSVYCLCAAKNGYVVAGTDHGIFLFDNAKQTWKQQNQGLPLDVNVWEITTAGSKLVMYANSAIWSRLLAEIK